MSDDSVDRQINDLERRAQDVGITLSPELKSELQQKLTREAQQKAELAARQQAESGGEPTPPGQPSSLRREMAAPDDNADKPVLRRDLASAEQRLQATERNAAVQSREPQGIQPLAVGERATAERAETGPEKKDKEIYLAEKRLSRL